MKKQRRLLFPLAIAAVLSPLFLITNLVLRVFYTNTYNGYLIRKLRINRSVMYLCVHSIRDFSGFLLYDSFSVFFRVEVSEIAPSSCTSLAQESRLAVVLVAFEHQGGDDTKKSSV